MGENFLEIPTQYRLFGITSHPSKLFFPLTPLGEEVERNVAGSVFFVTSRPGGFEIRRKKGSTSENGGFVIPL